MDATMVLTQVGRGMKCYRYGRSHTAANDYKDIPDRLSGSLRTLVPVAAKMALQTAGAAGAIGGSPSPVGELSLWMKWHSMSGAWPIRNNS